MEPDVEDVEQAENAEEMVTVHAEGHPGRLAVLSTDDCWRLLDERPVGRIAWTGSRDLLVVPVNFAVEADRSGILVRTSPYSLLARECVDRRVAFEVDQIDEAAHSGWSVLAHGMCQRQERPAQSPVPWVTGPRVLTLRIAVDTITGRVLAPAAQRPDRVSGP